MMLPLLPSAILAALPPLPQNSANWVVYLLLCNNGAFYCGITNRPTIPWRALLSGKGARYTRMYSPLQMRLVFQGINKTAAARCEYGLKRLTAKQKAYLWQILENFAPNQDYSDV